MGIAQPYAAELRHLGPAPGPPQPMELADRVHDVIHAAEGGVSIAGHVLAMVSDDGAEEIAARLRDVLYLRVLARRPHADEATWQSLTDQLRAQLRSMHVYDESVARLIAHTVDGL